MKGQRERWKAKRRGHRRQAPTEPRPVLGWGGVPGTDSGRGQGVLLAPHTPGSNTSPRAGTLPGGSHSPSFSPISVNLCFSPSHSALSLFPKAGV